MELLFEIFSEEIPARMQSGAKKLMAELAEKELKDNEIEFETLESFVSARRLALVVKGLDFSKTQLDKFIFKKGPSTKGPEQELEEFQASLHSQEFELIKKEIQGEEYFFAKLTKPKESPEELIKKLLERMLQIFPWPKSMWWDESKVKWVRPIRNLLCLLNGEIIPIKYGELVANNISFGHRFLSPEAFNVSSSEEYFSRLKRGKVILNSEERKQLIKAQLASCLSHNNSLKTVEDEGLLEEVAGLVEYPFVLLGEIDKSFLNLPKEVIISALRTHQRYFVVGDEQGGLSPHFIVVSNMDSEKHGKEILAGNQKVLQARLADAQFFFNEDRKTTLESRVEALKSIIFHEKIGTLFDKTLQVEKILEKLANQTKFDLALAKRAARLAKADLTTNLVKEFPELQGTIGKYYAKLDGENEIVAEAIADHYLPKGNGEGFPASLEGCMVALADKISTLTSLFGAGEVPTSSKDPFALRRQAVGIVKLLCQFKLSLNITEIFDNSLESSKAIIDFLFNRFKFFLKDHFKSTLIEAVLATSYGDFYSDFNKLTYLSSFVNSEEGHNTLLSIKRITNLLQSTTEAPSNLNEQLLNEQEKNLHEAISTAQAETQSLDKNNHLARLTTFSKLSKTIDLFFDKVLVMDENPELRTNRLALLHKANALFTSFADFGLIETISTPPSLRGA